MGDISTKGYFFCIIVLNHINMRLFYLLLKANSLTFL